MCLSGCFKTVFHGSLLFFRHCISLFIFAHPGTYYAFFQAFILTALQIRNHILEYRRVMPITISPFFKVSRQTALR